VRDHAAALHAPPDFGGGPNNGATDCFVRPEVVIFGDSDTRIAAVITKANSNSAKAIFQAGRKHHQIHTKIYRKSHRVTVFS